MDSSAQAELKMSPVFGDSMVLQRDQPVRVWGWTTAGHEVTVAIAGHEATATADEQGRFEVMLDALPAGGPHEMTIAADESRTFTDVLVGEVWVCSGQSNMQWSLGQSNDADLEALTAKYPNLRLITVPTIAAQTPKNDFNGSWKACTPKTVKDFSGVGYLFGRQLHETLDVPVGLIDNAWGGSAAEAWVPQDVLAADGKYEDLLKRWQRTIENYNYEEEVAKWNERVAKWEADGKQGPKPRKPNDQLQGNHRPGNLYNGVLHPIIGYTIRGTIWYQGESNAGRAYQYRDLFPLMIETWRKDWRQGDFSFYWVQLADFMNERTEPSDSAWAELREAQTMTMSKLTNTGEAVIINLGEASDIHPKNKQDVAKRLARWALAKDYGYTDLAYHSPTYASHEVQGDKIVVTFDHVGGGLDTFDVNELRGFTIAGDDKAFVNANAKILGKDKVQVRAESVTNPVSVRYGWADNPITNVQSKEGLPVTPFRTDDWEGVTANNR
ncbi:sialate O-acetylesterase [Rubripirellula amarantea]|nr:sialate O-acetylesterase [Rubripirellula amarantea]